jgi:hypothetical protein
VNASRSILKAWEEELKKTGGDEASVANSFVAEAARLATIEMRDAIRAAIR